MEREEALDLVHKNIKRKNLVKHVLAVEAIMRMLAERMGKDVKRWGLLGLLHDLDFDETYNRPELHATKTVEMLKDKVDYEMIRAIKAHNYEYTGVEPKTEMEKALIAADAISGLIVACALVMPSKTLAEVRPQTVIRRLKQKDFARNCNRNHMLLCRELGLSWEEFAELSLQALQSIHKELEL